MNDVTTQHAPGTARLRPDLFLLDRGIVHLNHGSFGAVPTPVLAAQREASEKVECSPERFYRRDLSPAIERVRSQVAAFLGTDPAGLVLVHNATEAVQVVLNSIAFDPGSEIVFTDHTYGWVQAAIARTCAEYGSVPRRIPLPFPLGPGALLEALKAAINPRTKLVVIDQVTSGSALRLPVEEVCAAIGTDVPVLVDGAHAPGLIDDPVPAGASYWLGNLHKWAFAPRTAAALVVAPQHQARIRPLVTSAGVAAGFPESFSYLGTRDASAYLALPAALAFPGEHLGMTFGELRRRNVAVLAEGMRRLGLDGSTGSPGLPMATVALNREGDAEAAWRLTARLWEEGVEVAVAALGGELHLRLSVQAYVAPEDFEVLAAALPRALAGAT